MLCRHVEEPGILISCNDIPVMWTNLQSLLALQLYCPVVVHCVVLWREMGFRMFVLCWEVEVEAAELSNSQLAVRLAFSTRVQFRTSNSLQCQFLRPDS